MRKRNFRPGRRTAVPADRHKRAVAFRHQPYKALNIRKETAAEIEETVIEDVVETAPVTEEVKQPAVKPITPVVPSKPKKDHIGALKKWFSERGDRKAAKKAAYEAELDALADEATASLPLILFKATVCIARVSKEDHSTLNPIVSFLVPLIKWIVIMWIAADCMAGIINVNPFGFARMNYTDTAAVAFKLGIFAYICEIISYKLISMTQSTVDQKYDLSRLMSINTYGHADSLLLYVLVLVVMKYNMLAGVALFVTAIVYDLVIRAYVFAKALRSKVKAFPILLLTTFLFTMAGIMYFNFACADIIEIFKNIMNI